MPHPRAFCLIQSAVYYRREAFEAGLKACGFTLEGDHHIGTIRPTDALVIWNRYNRSAILADQFEKAGAVVIVAENGYLGRSENCHAKPYTTETQEPENQLYALALNFHNGAGRWPVGEPGRWRAQGIEVKPWRTDGEHVLVLPQRGIGPAGVAMPRDWPERTVQRLRTMTERPVRLRAHPGNAPAQKPLAADLEGCWCATTWGSGAALKTLCAGVPVFCDFPKWIGAGATRPLSGGFIEQRLEDDRARERMLDRLAWAQWTVAELATGEPFRRLLELHLTERTAA